MTEELYERLREQAHQQRVKMNDLMVEGLELRLAPDENAMAELARGYRIGDH